LQELPKQIDVLRPSSDLQAKALALSELSAKVGDGMRD
jgi:hypothetical protein